ncbi:DUF4446 family protein [Xylanivirga thermophila]|uniref:DUF4446 family protein n=1 Tax=Xylanivirga thermophila TaxID=2496273 RepID=UPI0013EB33F8|nr:DUF4446 family protein [Xylanivirga thermophila]
MKILYSFVHDYYIEICLAASMITLLSLILVIVNFSRTTKILRRYKRLMRGVDNKNLEFILNQQFDKIEQALNTVDMIEENHNTLLKQVNTCVQNVGVIRYNAFDDMGSQQSYSVAILDNEKNGVVLTGLFGRDSSSTYAKPIVNGKSNYPLSEEEIQAIQNALNQK